MPSYEAPSVPIIYVDSSAKQENVRRIITGRMDGTIYRMGPCRLATDYVYLFIMKNLKRNYLVSMHYIYDKHGGGVGGTIYPAKDENFKFLRKYPHLDSSYLFNLTIRQVVAIVLNIRRYERFIYLK